MKELIIKTEYIKLDSALKYSSIVYSGGLAKELIKNGNVKVNNEICKIRGKKLRENDKVEVLINNKLYIFIIKNT